MDSLSDSCNLIDGPSLKLNLKFSVNFDLQVRMTRDS